MQPYFLRFITMIALLISVICGNAKETKEEIREIQGERRNEENYEELPHDQMLDIDMILSDSSSRRTDKLAQKFANDALKSLKMQETINKLADIGVSQNDLYKVSQLPAREHIVKKSKVKSNRSKAIRHKDRKQKKRKRHRHKDRWKRLKNRRPRWSKTRPAKVDHDSSNKENALKMKIHLRGRSNNPKEKRIKMLRNKVPNDNTSTIDNMTLINWDNLDVEDYIDLTQSTNSEFDASTISIRTERTEGMIERSIKTFTKNPRMKYSDDQGVEYADYYDVVDRLNERRKLQEKRKNPRARSIRQSFTVSSFNRNSNDYLYIPNENVENNPDFKYLDENSNNFENHFTNSLSSATVQTNNENDDSLNLQIGKENEFSPNELKSKKLYGTMILAMSQDKNLRPTKSSENLIAGVSNFTFSKLGENERSRPLLVGQENSSNTHINPAILRSNEHQYKLPVENNDINLYNNYVFNSERKGKVQQPLKDYATLLQKQDDKYTYPIAYNLPEDRLNDQFQLPDFNKNVENTMELKNPTNVYSKQYEKSFVLPQDQQLLRYLPVYKNTHQGGRLLLVNTSKARNDETSKNLRENININENERLRKMSDTLISREHVQPVERFPSLHNFESGDTLRMEDDANNLMDQPIMRRGLQKGFENSENSKKVDESVAEEEERRLRKEFGKARKTAIVRNRYSVEEDVANSQRADIAATVNETKEVADQILNRIVDELEEIKMDHSKYKNSEGFPCKLTGSWVTSKAGVRIDIKVMNQSVIIVTLANLIPRPMHVGLLNTTWNVTGNAPFKRGGPFSLFAYDNRTKTLAIFVGSCRVCQGIDTIAGVWSVAREPRDCRNFQMATEIFNDIFRRTKLLSAIKEKKKAILRSMLMKNVTNITLYSGVRKDENDQND